MNRIIARTTSFGQTASTAFMGEAVVKQIANPSSEVARPAMVFSDKRDFRLMRTLRRANQAYIVDGIVRQSVDKYTELCGGFYLDGGEKPVQAATRRLELMSLQSGEHWRTTVNRFLHEYFKNGNPMFTKVRGDTPKAKRAFYKNHPYPIAAIYLLSSERVEPAFDDKGRPMGWTFLSAGTSNDPGLLIEGSTPKPVGDALMRLPTLDSKYKGVLRPGLDLVHIPYKRGADSLFGVGVTFAALEDIALQRSIEQIAASVVKKNSHPMVHIRIIRPTSHMGNLQREIDETAARYKRAAPDSVIVTGGQTEMKMLGTESQALRLDTYLEHFTKRAFCSLGVSPYLMGFEGATLGTASAAQALLLDRVRSAQEELAQELEMFLIWELLWECGFDPYNNEADRVYLRFKEKDPDRRIKEESHWIDAYNKGVIDVDELRVDKLGLRKPYKYDRLYLNQIQLPLAKAEYDNKIEVAKIQAAARPKPTKSEARRITEKYRPEHGDDVESFVLLLETLERIPRETFSPYRTSLEALVSSKDFESFDELVVQILTEDPA